MLSYFRIGHYTDQKRATGCTVILPPDDTVASACVRGASPGTRELVLLSPERKISQITALLLTGGSAFGLGAAQGLVEKLAQQQIGYQTNYGVVPIVPAAVIFDKNIGDPAAYPTAENAALALDGARFRNNEMGNVGAGTGATVGKWKGIEHAMKGGLGVASLQAGVIKVTVMTVVNAVGDVLDKNGKILAGAIDKQNRFFAEQGSLSRWNTPQVGMARNTVLSAILTNARLSKQQAYYLAERGHNGIARRIDPSHTSYDGDVTFVLAHARETCDIDLCAGLTVEAVEQSIINAIKNADTLFNIKSLKEIRKAEK